MYILNIKGHWGNKDLKRIFANTLILLFSLMFVGATLDAAPPKKASKASYKTDAKFKKAKFSATNGKSAKSRGPVKKTAAKPYAPQSAAIVMDAHTGKVFMMENPDAKTYPASLTKIMTLYMLFEALETKKVKLTTRMTVSRLATTQIPSKIGLKVGETIRVQDALLALVTKSANDASVVIAEHLAGSVEAFAAQMNAKSRVLGMRNTRFTNPNGTPDKAQVTTARDMALLSKSLYTKFPAYYRYFKTRSFTYKGQVYRNHNHLLGRVPGLDGIKTGFINASGFNLAASAKRDQVRLIGVVMGGHTAAARDKRMSKLLEEGFYLAKLNLKKSKNDPNMLQASAENPAAMTDLTHKNVEPELYVENKTQTEVEQDPLHYVSADEAQGSNDETQPATIKTVAEVDEGGFDGTRDSARGIKNAIIQIGAYKRQDQAFTKVSEVNQSLAIANSRPSVEILRHKNKKKWVFQARIKNLTKDQADNACKVLSANGTPCLVLSKS